jgi:hypothetical protein
MSSSPYRGEVVAALGAQVIRDPRQRVDDRWSWGTLQSSTRSGFVSVRRWQSPQSLSAAWRRAARSVST